MNKSSPPKLVMIDVDGILTRNKFYNKDGQVVGKEFHDHDWTAIKAFQALKIPVVFLTGDEFNVGIADRRNIPIYLSVTSTDRLDKKEILPDLLKHYNVSPPEVVYLADDIFDLSVLQEIGWPFCPKESPQIVRDSCIVLSGSGGETLVSKMLDWFVTNKQLSYPDINEVFEIDRIEHILQDKFYIYKITNQINGKCYIGQSCKPNRWDQHKANARSGVNLKIAQAIKKHGVQNFTFEILTRGPSLSWALRFENLYISQYKSHVHGYNIVADSRGYGNPMLGRKHSKKSITKMSEALIGKNKGSQNPRAIWNYYLIDPNGQKHQTDCLTGFCRKHDLNRRSMANLTAGNLKGYKGWTGSKKLKDNKQVPNINVTHKSRTHCRHGHQLNTVNSYVNPKGVICCRACNRLSVKKSRDNKK